MALQFISTTMTTQSGTTVQLGTVDNAYVTATGFVGAATGTGINSDGSQQQVRVFGGVFGSTGVYMGSNPTTNFDQYLYVGRTGTISGNGTGVQVLGTASTVINQGEISAKGYGVVMNGVGSGTTTLTNDGTITGNIAAITRASGATDTLVIRNDGTLASVAAAFDALGGAGVTKLINNGTISGTITFGGGNDIYDGRGGSVDGTISGGAGRDLFRPGDGIEVIDGGTGDNTLDFRGGAAVRVALDGSFANTGRADEDTYTNIQNLFGSSKADVLAGDAGDNQFAGGAGNDKIYGRDGLDLMDAGAGVDTLSGGAGDDTFVFSLPSECGDAILDFGSSAGNNDRIGIIALGFGGGLLANMGVLTANLFQSRADNLAQDADDRFIFNTTDKTLWFDANGNLAGAAILVADLQANATLTFDDIYIG